MALVMVLAPALSVAAGPGQGGAGMALTLDSRGSVNDTDSEPNDDASEATNVTGNVTIGGTITSQDASDFYRVHMNNTTAPNRLNASLIFSSTHGGTIAYLAILDPEEFRLDQVLCTGSETNASAMALRGGWYYLGILWDIQNHGSATITYTLNTSLVYEAVTPDGNDHPDEAVQVSDEDLVTSDLDELYDAADFYGIHLAVGPSSLDVILLVLEMEATVDIAIEVYTSAYTFIRQINAGGEGGDEVAYFVAPATDDYLFRLWANTGSGAYNLSVRSGTGFRDNDNTVENATLIPEGLPAEGNLTDDYDPDDFYKVSLVLGEEVTVTLSALDYNDTLMTPVINIWLYNGTSYVKNSTNTPNKDKWIWYEAEAAGTYYIRAGAADMSFGRYSLSVTVVSPPVVLSHDPVLEVDEDGEAVLDLSTIFQDPEGGALTFDVEGSVSTSVVIDGANATVSSLVQDWYGSEDVTFSATNSLGKTSWATITLSFQPKNDPPRAIQPYLDLPSIDEDDIYVLTMSFLSTKFTDVDGDDLTFEFLPHAYFTFNVTNDTITLVPAEDWNGVAELLLVAKDPSGLEAVLQVNLTVLAVNDEPVASPMADIELDEDGSTTVDLADYFMDPDGDDLVYDGYGEGDLEGVRHIFVSFNGTNATLTLTPDWYGEEKVVFTAKDTSNATATLSVLVIVTKVNDPPKVDQTTWEEYSLNTWLLEDHPKSFDLSKLFVDPDGDDLTFKVNSAGDHLTVTMNGVNMVVTPAIDWFGVEDVNVSAVDPEGLKAWTELQIVVKNENDRPFLSNGVVKPEKGDEDTVFVFTVIVSDIDGDEPIVTVVIDGKEQRMTKGSGDIRTGAAYTYSSKLKGGKHTFSFKADDGTHVATSEATLQGGEIDIEEPLDTETYLFYGIIVIVIILILALAAAAYNRAQRMKEFDDSWDDDEEEDEESGFPEEDE